ncbi:MAG TPA: hypothetical protein VJP84_11525 [Steroidobacteraceae bacterium]|jgi:hypothetical protein|nr:hypothetical protein [Steroidobacteraceae bacterium]
MRSALFCTLTSLALAACQTAGTGSGNVRGTKKPVAFTWQSTDSVSGDITATFGSGRVFKGTYFQITQDTRVDHLGPLWDGWGQPYRRGGNWRYWTHDPGPKFVKTYSGRVLANLHDNTGEHMRCRFTLISPSRGMAGGGEGRCQLSESEQEINAEFPRQS